MAGFADDATGQNIVYCDNVDFSGGAVQLSQINANGQLMIGAAASPHIRPNTLTAGTGITITNGPGTISIALTGGGVAVETLTPDTGGTVTPTLNTIPTLGQKAGTVATMQTYNDGVGNLRIADQTWTTQYVVDASSTSGLKGTFTTIQSAIDQAVIDLGVSNQIATIFIRKGSYSESLVMPAKSIHLIGYTEDGWPLTQPTSNYNDVSITGDVTFAASANAIFTNIRFVSGDPTISITTAIKACSFNYCTITGTPAVSVSGSGSLSTGFFASNTQFSGGLTLITSAFTFNNCKIGGNVSVTSCSPTFNFCQVDSAITTATSGTVSILNCMAEGDTWTAGVSTTIYISNLACTGTVTLAGAGEIKYGMISGGQTTTATTQTPLLVSNDAVKLVSASGASYTTKAQDAVILVDGAVTATIVPMASPTTGQKHVIKDNAGTAASNNITVTPSGKNIDGAASSVMNVNYGSLTIVYNGTQWIII